VTAAGRQCCDDHRGDILLDIPIPKARRAPIRSVNEPADNNNAAKASV
jgi:hypothetical protein